MKLSFSNNGWDESFSSIVTLASEYGLDGIEIHDPHQDVFAQEEPFIEENIEKTQRLLGDHSLRISCFDVIGNIADETKMYANIKEIKSTIRLANRFDCRYVRLRAYKVKFGIDDEVDEKVIEILNSVIACAEENNVTILIETMGVYSDTGRLRTILAYFNNDHIAALWDPSHTVNFGAETPAKTVGNLGAYIKHVHIKDIKKERNAGWPSPHHPATPANGLTGRGSERPAAPSVQTGFRPGRGTRTRHRSRGTGSRPART